jgi:GNAT superfamily N-acetyltransferase
MSAPRDGASDASEGTEIRVHLCTPADRGEQADLVNACFKKKVDARALAWRYDENPHGEAISFVSRAGDRAVCGYACSPRIALAHGDAATRAPIGETGDVMTHPDWRRRGLFSALDRAALQETARRGWPVVLGLPNRRSAHIFTGELGWSAVGTVRPWTFLFRADAAARAARSREGRVRGWLAAHAARRCARLRARNADTARPLRVEELARIPADVGAISRRVAREFALMVERDAEWLTWRFLESPSGLHRVLGLRADDGTLQGYAVVQLPRSGEAHGYVVDLLASDAGAEAAAMEAALARLEAAGASYAEATAIDGSWWSGRLASAGFLAPRARNHLLVIVRANQPDHPLSLAALDPKRWYFTDGDRDDETMG